MNYSDQTFDRIQVGINARQSELNHVTNVLASSARRLGRRGVVGKVMLIFLGALVATRETAAEIFGVGNTRAAAFYAIVGVGVAVIAGLEAAFKWESRGADLKTLAATCQATARSVDSQWRRHVGPTVGGDRIDAGLALLDLQDQKLADVQKRAAELGVNITLEVRELDAGESAYPA